MTMRLFNGPVVAGVDGSAHAERAAVWAATEAARAGRMLHLVTAIPTPVATGTWYVTVPLVIDPDVLTKEAEESLERVETAIRRQLGADTPAIERVIVDQAPARALAEASEGASLLVVGARGLGTFGRLVLGSVSQALVHRSRSSIAVIGGKHRPDRTEQPVVVGVDGSPGSQVALRWALREADRFGVELIAVHGLDSLEQVSLDSGIEPGQLEGMADAFVAAQVEEAAEDTDTAPDVRRLARPVSAAEAILTTAEDEDASLVVVGSRGRSALAGTLLGSVSQQVSHHSDRPFVIVRDTSNA